MLLVPTVLEPEPNGTGFDGFEIYVIEFLRSGRGVVIPNFVGVGLS